MYEVSCAWPVDTAEADQQDMTSSLDRMDPSDVRPVSSCRSTVKLTPQPNLFEVLDKLKETHATSAGLKAFCTWACLDTIDKCRQSCGGHGYSA